MGDNAEHRDSPQAGSSGDDSGAANDPLTQIGVTASQAEFNGRKPA